MSAITPEQKARRKIDGLLPASITSSSLIDEVSDVSPPIADFIKFVTRAESVVPRSMVSAAKPRLVENFRSFVTKAGRTLDDCRSGSQLLDSFQAFVDQSMTQIFANIRQALPLIAERANLVAGWLVKDDLLAVAGCRFVEDAYTELMAWALHPETHPASARRRQAAWLTGLGLDPTICESAACVPRTQVRTDDGIPDLVMQFKNTTIGVEAKTGSTEHVAPSGKMQTAPYVESLPQALDLAQDHVLKLVFITPDGRPASNDDAICTTYTKFVLALATALEGQEMPATHARRFRFSSRIC